MEAAGGCFDRQGQGLLALGIPLPFTVVFNNKLETQFKLSFGF